MKKNIILSLCIAAVLLACFADGYFRKDRAWQTFSGAWQEDNGAGSGAQNDAGTALENGVQNGAETALGSSAQSGIGTVQENSVPASAGTVSGNSAQNGAGNGAQNGAGTAQENSVQNGAGTASGNSARIRVTRDIRVLIKTAGFQSVYHDCVTVDTDSGFSIVGGSSRKSCPPGEAVFSVASEEFQGSGILRLIAQDGQFHVKNLNRERQSDVYSGILELRRMDEGILLINELPLEDYLTGVVSSEMPSSYPMEALKAQAVCARTYARKRMEEQGAAAYFADVDDSVSYQVYNNQEHTPQIDEAVGGTAGVVMTGNDGELIDALYYSTSCGLDTHTDLSGEAIFAAFLSESSLRSYEAEEPWYRWQTDLTENLLGNIQELHVKERLPSGIVNCLAVSYRDGTEETLEGEYNVRAFLGGLHPTVILQDGETVRDMELLPSAFFILQPLQEDGVQKGYHILGGGYGHGNGMSQNGAKHMALEGMGYREILETYYGDIQIS